LLRNTLAGSKTWFSCPGMTLQAVDCSDFISSVSKGWANLIGFFVVFMVNPTSSFGGYSGDNQWIVPVLHTRMPLRQLVIVFESYPV